MSDPIITVENLGKRYVLGHQRCKDEGLRHVLEDAMRAPLTWLRRLREQEKQQHEEFWALKNVTFQVQPGETVGIIGRNGAGKSTLLKILSRITEPTSGRVRLQGRVASLLEVGTGFHPELTGRENIFLNGAILGMAKVEIQRKFDEIVGFSEVEKFLDTPVKRFSSGMYVRLAFAVAAHLEPDILIIDEVLAVGDSSFQKKCLGKMQEVADHGRTVIFVSHNMASISQFCRRVLCLKDGCVEGDGPPADIVQHYFRSVTSTQHADASGLAFAELNGSTARPMRLLRVAVRDSAGELLNTDCPHIGLLAVEIDYEVRQTVPDAFVSCSFVDVFGVDAYWQYDADSPDRAARNCGTYRTRFEVPANFLRAGRYFIRPAIIDPRSGALDYYGTLFHLTVADVSSFLARRGMTWPSLVKSPVVWQTSRIGELKGTAAAPAVPEATLRS